MGTVMRRAAVVAGAALVLLGPAAGAGSAAREVPGIAPLQQSPANAQIGVVSCASPGNCSAGGPYEDGSPRAQAFVVSQVHGTWGKAIRQ